MGQDSKFRVNVEPQVWFVLAVVLILIPLPWACAWLFAAIAHELCHCLAIYLCDGRIYRIKVTPGGAKIETEELTDGKILICTLAGPLGGVLLTLFSSRFPRLAVCGFCQSLFNLLPIYPLDGGRALGSFLAILRRFVKKIKIPCKCIRHRVQ